MRLHLSFGLVSRLVGLLLLAAAALKIQGLAVAPMAHVGVFSAAWVQVGVVILEILLGSWLLWGTFPSASWLMTTALFSLFALVNFHIGWIGQVSCGCLGAIKANPWLMFGLDLFVLGLLFLGRPDLSPLWNNTRTQLLRQGVSALGILLAALAVLGILAAASAVWFGSPNAALAYLRGEKVSVSPRLVNLGSGFVGEMLEGQIEVTNWTDKSVRLFGGTFDCACTVLEDLPVTLLPGKSCSLRVQIVVRHSGGMFTHKAFLRTDCAQQSMVPFQLTGYGYPLPKETAEDP